MVAYTYLIGWSDLQTFYYGVRYKKGCHPSDLWTKYFTSSKHVKAFRKTHGEPDIIQVRRTFECVHSARIWESKVLRRLKAHLNSKMLNRITTIGIYNPPEHYVKLGLISKSRKWTAEQRKAHSDLVTPERKAMARELWQKTGNEGLYEITEPNGSVVIIQGLGKYCSSHGLGIGNMSSLSKGKYVNRTNGKLYDNYKGYKIKKLGTVFVARQNHQSPQ